jgi:phage repressor protein C with HTH and peptisase S24 domain
VSSNKKEIFIELFFQTWQVGLMDILTKTEAEQRKAEIETAIELAGGKEFLAEAIDTSVRSIDSWRSGKGMHQRNLIKVREFIAANKGKSVTHANGHAILSPMQANGTAHASSSNHYDDPEFVEIALREATGSMGGGSLETGKTIKRFLKFRNDWIRSIPANPANLSCIMAYGDSMSPTITDGSVILIDEGRPDFTANKVFYIRHNGQMYLKRLMGKPGEIDIISDAYPENIIQVLPDDDFEIIGRALWMGRRIE